MNVQNSVQSRWAFEAVLLFILAFYILKPLVLEKNQNIRMFYTAMTISVH